MRHQTKVLRDKLQLFLTLIKHMSDKINLVVGDQLDSQAPLTLYLECHYWGALRPTKPSLDQVHQLHLSLILVLVYSSKPSRF